MGGTDLLPVQGPLIGQEGLTPRAGSSRRVTRQWLMQRRPLAEPLPALMNEHGERRVNGDITPDSNRTQTLWHMYSK